ncbi:MAG: M4 family metallopeptidase [Blastocatellia bacterium]
MKTRKFSVLTVTIALLLSTIFPPFSAQAQSELRARTQPSRRGQSVRSWRAANTEHQSLEGQELRRPDWVNTATRRSLTRLTAMRETLAIENAATDLTLRSAEQDDLGHTHLRLTQRHRGVEVFGSQLISHIKGNEDATIGGRTFDVKEVETTPAISAEQAIENAKAALNFQGEFASEPTAKLVVLPHQVFDKDAANVASLTYQVTLNIEDGTDATALHQYFVSAQDGQIVWHYDALPKDGTGYSLYSGTVNVPTFWFGSYLLTDLGHGNCKVFDLNGTTTGTGDHMSDTDNIWGDGTTGNRQSAAVDVQYGIAKTWDYYLNVLGRRGMDGNNGAIDSRVHYGSRYNNAFYSWNSNQISFGDGDGSRFNPLVSLDIVAHEFTHGVTERTANLVYANESGALNESFSDIFGTAVEFYTKSNANYLIGEDCFTPGTAGDALRSMSNPASAGDPDHYSNRYTGTNDNGGVHTNSGIQNQAFYLLAAGGTNPTSNITVDGIGRRNAELIFWRALVYYLFPSANFYDARVATVNAAADLFGPDSKEHRATEAAWEAVGVSGAHLFFYNAQNGSAAAVQVTNAGQFGWQVGYGAGALSTEWSNIVPVANYLLFYNTRTGLYAVAKVDQNGKMTTVNNGYIARNMTKVAATDKHVFFFSEYDRSGFAGTVNTSSGAFSVTQSFGAGAFSPWTDIVDTKYGMFFYNRADGTVAVVNVQANGTLNQTDGKVRYLAAGYDQVVVQGEDVLLYNSATGAYVPGFVDSRGKFDFMTLTSCGATLPAGYKKIVAANNKLFFYNPNTGAGAVGFLIKISGKLSPYPYYCAGQLSIQKTYSTFATGWTHLVNTSNGLLFYNQNNRAGAVGRFASDGSFVQTQGFGAGAFGYWTSIITTEK